MSADPSPPRQTLRKVKGWEEHQVSQGPPYRRQFVGVTVSPQPPQPFGMRSVLLVALVWAIISPYPLLGQGSRLPVFVYHSGDDFIGSAVAYAVRERLRSSQAFSLSTEDRALVTISIASLEIENLPQSALSVVFMMKDLTRDSPYPLYLTSVVYIVGRDRTTEIAGDIVARLDSRISQLLGLSARSQRFGLVCVLGVWDRREHATCILEGHDGATCKVGVRETTPIPLGNGPQNLNVGTMHGGNCGYRWG